MRKKFFPAFLLLLLIIPIFVNRILAQGKLEDIIDFNTQEIKCGVAGLDNKDKCCPLVEIGRIPDFPPINDPFGVKGKYDELKKGLEDLQKGIQKPCFIGVPSTKLDDPNCHCIFSLTPSPIPGIKDLCNKYLKGFEKERCEDCANNKGGLWTGVGCVPLQVNSFIGYLLRLGIGLGGFIGLLCIIYASFILQTSQGNPEKIKKGQELLTSCIMGMLLIIFSVFILRLIGVDILKIPGFKKY